MGTAIKIVLSPINHVTNSTLPLLPPLNCFTKSVIPVTKGSNEIKNKDKAARTAKIRKNVFTLSTSSCEYGPPYLSLAKSILFGTSFSQYVRALRFLGYLLLMVNLTTS